MRVLCAAWEYYQRSRNPVAYARGIGVRVGSRCRLLGLTSATFGSEPFLVSLGDDVTVTAGVRFVTHDGGVDVFRDEYPDLELVAPIDVGDRVFIGLGTVVLPGVSIGPRSVVGAGSVVTRDVPGGTVAAGVPARPLCSIEEYRARALSLGTHTRGLPSPDRRSIFESLAEDRSAAGGH